ncbi:MAG: ABC transporter ATP-binding protein [Anaerolineales bacterium]|nr:ABC transporter ATP-binding protein [Anaerolineales bacterium]
MEQTILVQELRKSFGSVHAVDGVSFSAGRGEIFSLLGPNGAGKTTTISMLAGLLRPDSGDAALLGNSIRSRSAQARAVLGVVPQEVALYMDLSARENLSFWGKMYNLRGKQLNRRIDEILGIIGLEERQKGRVGSFSGGMKRRVNIGVALLHQPPIVIMDEPTVGIDPQSRRHILDAVKQLRGRGMTVLYTTHYMEEAEELSDRIAIMDQGRIIASGTNADLVKLVGQDTRIELAVNAESARVLELWRSIEGVRGASADDGRITVLAADSHAVLPRLFESAAARGARITSLEIREPNLEAVFLHLTGRALRE